MSWLTRVLGRERARASAADSAPLEELLRLGRERRARGELEGAKRCYGEILERDPRQPEALYWLGVIEVDEHRYAEAVERFRTAVAAQPDEPRLRFALGTALLKAKHAEEAVEVLLAGLALNPQHVAMHYNLATALLALGDYEQAHAELERVRAKEPDLPQAHSTLGYIHRQFGRIPEALAAYRRALELDPDDADTHSNLLLTLNYSAEHTPAEIFAEHRRFGERHVKPVPAPAPDPAWPRRLRVGYVSPDFRSHVVSCFLWAILARHDRERFEVFCYYTYPEADPVTARLRELADHWADCAHLSDADFVARIRADRIDLLVDLAGHTWDQRLKVFALRPAPVQASYLGYPNTTGLGAVQYRITDARADPPGDADRFHVERLVRLPRCFVCYRAGPDVHAVAPLPALAAGRVTFGCFNAFQKLSGPFYDAAARILGAVPQSRLLLKAMPLGSKAVAAAVRERFANAGIDPARLTLRAWEPTVVDHLAVYHEVDIALDSFPYNGTTTTCEALWMGVPVVTLQGERHAGRVGSSLLHAVGLDSLVARSEAEYVQIAAQLAADLPQLAGMRAGMRRRMSESALMDEPGFVRGLEDAYHGMWRSCLEAAAPPRIDAAQTGRLFARARELRAAGDSAQAIAACAEVLRQLPAEAEALGLIWDLCHESGEPAAAIEWLGRAISVDPSAARFHYMLGCTLQDLGRAGEAIAAHRKALELDPGLAKAANNLGCLLEAAGDLDGALECYERALGSDPGLAHAVYNRGNVHKQRGDSAGAAADFRKALALEPAHADWHCNLGEALTMRWQLDEAVASHRAALELDPQHARGHCGLGVALQAAGRVDEAEQCFRRALAIEPAYAEAHSNLLLCLHYRKGDEPQLLHEEHQAWAERHARGVAPLAAPADPAPAADGRLHVGYVSPDFRRHSVAWFIEPVLRAHDRDRFRVFCYSNSSFQDEVTARLRGCCDEWRDISRMSDGEAARRILEDRIDILVDLAGHTGGNRLLVFARKPAPVQVSWLGYPDTTGLAAIDCRLTDPVADPEGASERYYPEKLLRLPNGFLCYAAPQAGPEPGEPPSCGAKRITFGCFNNLAKVTPHMVELWSRLLAARQDSKLILKAPGLGSDGARRELLARFVANEVAAERIELRGEEPSHARHLACYLEVDIALDTYPYCGATTTCEALWMGVPVITLAGRTHVSRVGASLLARTGLSDLIAHTADEYLAKALALAQDGERLRELRARLRPQLLASPLLDGAAFTRSLEAAYRDLRRAPR